MTTITARAPARARGALAAEWIKLRSVRSTYLIPVSYTHLTLPTN